MNNQTNEERTYRVSTKKRQDTKKKKVEEKSFELVAKRRTREKRIACHRCPFRASKHRSRVLCERARRACTVLENHPFKKYAGARARAHNEGVATREKKRRQDKGKKTPVSILLTFVGLHLHRRFVDLHLHRRIIGVTKQPFFTRHRSFVRLCDFFTQSSASSKLFLSILCRFLSLSLSFSLFGSSVFFPSFT